MMHGQYCRIETKAGGRSASNRAFIRACLSVVQKKYRFSREARLQRHIWIREGLEHKKQAYLF